MTYDLTFREAPLTHLYRMSYDLPANALLERLTSQYSNTSSLECLWKSWDCSPNGLQDLGFIFDYRQLQQSFLRGVWFLGSTQPSVQKARGNLCPKIKRKGVGGGGGEDDHSSPSTAKFTAWLPLLHHTPSRGGAINEAKRKVCLSVWWSVLLRMVPVILLAMLELNIFANCARMFYLRVLKFSQFPKFFTICQIKNIRQNLTYKGKRAAIFKFKETLNTMRTKKEDWETPQLPSRRNIYSFFPCSAKDCNSSIFPYNSVLIGKVTEVSDKFAAVLCLSLENGTSMGSHSRKSES